MNSLQFYQTQAESLGIGGILVTGGTSHLEGLDEALHQMIGVDVSVGDPLARVDPCDGDRPRHRGDDRLAGRPDRPRDRGRRDTRHQPAAEGRAAPRRREPLDAPLDRRPGRGGDPARRPQLPVPRRPRQGRRQPDPARCGQGRDRRLAAAEGPGHRRRRRRRRGRSGDGGRAGARRPACLGRGLPRPGARPAGERLALDPAARPADRGGGTSRTRRRQPLAASRPELPPHRPLSRSTASRTPSPMSPASWHGSRRSPRCSA